MEEKKSTIPELTLDPVTEPEEKEQVPTAEETDKTMQEIIVASSSLSPEELAAVDSFAQKIDITNSTQIMQYGSASQQKLSQFADGALGAVRTKDLGETGEMITSLIAELKGFNDDTEKKGLRGFLKKKGRKIEALKLRYDKAEVNVDRIAGNLEQHQVVLMKDVAMLDQMYERNLDYFKEISMYILAGKQKLETERKTTLPELLRKADESGLPEDAQKARDFADLCTRFEKKIYDLELTRNISLQMAPQIRLIQNSDVLMVERIQSTINNTIPLWKNQMVLAMGMAHAQQTAQAQHEVNELTNELLKKNAETLKQGTVAIAQESERGVVDIETLQETNQKLIETFDEVLRIQDEGREKRAAAESELGRIEAELREKMLDIRG